MGEPKHVSASREVYKRTFSQHGVSLGTLMYGSQFSQHNRFARLAELLKPKGDEIPSVLDVGCGFGDFASFAKEHQLPITYTGLELVDEIAQAARENNPDCEIIGGVLEELPSDRTWDFAIQSGVFNIGCFDFAAAEVMVRQMFSHVTRGIAVNYLSRASTGKVNPDATYYDAADIVHLAERLTRRWSIKHDYQDNDFTLYLYHDSDALGGEVREFGIPESLVTRPTLPA